MPRLPVAIADPMTRWMGRPAVAARVEVLSPGLVRVTFEGEALRARQWQQGSEIEFRVSTRDFRHYTPASFDDDAGRIEVVFQLHGSGPGADWVRGVRTGDEVVILGPVRRSSWLRNGRRPVFVGDASALGLFQALIASLPDATDAVGVVEVPEADLDAASDLVPTLTVVASTDVPGEASLTWLADELSGTPDVAYLAGHAQSIQRQRAVLCDAAGDRPGLRRRNVVTKPFWATGKVGL